MENCVIWVCWGKFSNLAERKQADFCKVLLPCLAPGVQPSSSFCHLPKASNPYSAVTKCPLLSLKMGSRDSYQCHMVPEVGQKRRCWSCPQTMTACSPLPLPWPHQAPVLLTVHLSIFPGPLIRWLGLYILTDVFFWWEMSEQPADFQK